MRVVCSKQIAQGDDPLIPNEEVGHLAGLTRDKLEGREAEAKKWTCGICAFHNPSDKLTCVLCDTSKATFLLVMPEFRAVAGTLPLDQLNDKQRSAKNRNQWKRKHNGSAWEWQAFPPANAHDYLVLAAASTTDSPCLMQPSTMSAGRSVLGHVLPSWWSGQLAELQTTPFSLKYAWLLSYLATVYPSHAKLTLRRESIFDQSMYALTKAPTDQLCFLTIISLVGESAVDAGGVTREWYTLLTMAIMDERRGLFTVTNNADQSYYINPNSENVHGANHLDRYLAIGRLLGRAIIDEQVLPFHFCVPLFKMLLGYPVSMDDIRYLDPTVYSSLVYVRDCDDVDDLALTFSVTVDEAGSEVELVVGGRDIAVTNANKAEYVDRMVQYLLFDRVAPQLQHLVQGLYDVLPQELLMPFDYKELELILCGFSEIDVADWKRSTIVSKSLEDVVGWFWDVIEFDMTASERAKLLQFTTGSSRVPLQGFRALTSQLCPFSLHGVPYERGVFPKVHSCFNRIDLPIYPTRALLAEGLCALVNIQSMAFTMV
ncbi:hypothetical protein H310_11679 [Aphanomyces invadans]|uniref:HECT-type E3 ubiquitin transferase n=1 Tax=Aphanomyces invadans TaxID=157072 RepID=A0A024TL22_9STRA|nr:hypothetical protein H310_11679 [Aphanomyces invadans]ETV94704.1 hypothetical protein H310_11679 [Aphanomyces invadans]|eukprot:XP_008876649.1 hypothetical protein H310_11679 [Aphanomyces invadans]